MKEQHQHNQQTPTRTFAATTRRVAIRIAIVACAVALALSFVKVVDVPLLSSLQQSQQSIPTPQNEEKQATLSIEDKLAQKYSKFFDIHSNEVLLERLKFLENYSPNGEYGYDGKIDELVANELTRIQGEIYFDYTGAGVYQNSQIEKVFNDIKNNVYGNAHSRNPSALRTEKEIEHARNLILEHFHTTRDEYSVIFTQGATGALKLIAESFPWTNASKFVYLRQNHNSVLGIREIALDQGATFVAIPESELVECNKFIGGEPCDEPQTFGTPNHKRSVILTKFPESTYNLFAYPAEDNFAGVKYPLEWIKLFKDMKRGEAGTGHWLTLLDAAAYVPCNDLDLSKYPADFVTVSFYKMFGYPTGIGALLVRNDVTEIMQKTFFGGGTVVLSSCDTHFCLLHPQPCNRFEDGTPSFISISELKYGFEKLHELGMDNISKHVWSITSYLYNELSNMRHDNGKPVFVVYGKHKENNPDTQGSIINLNVLDANGEYIGYSTVQDLTATAGFHIRTGCNCNPGACFDYLHISSEEVVRYSLEKTSCGDEMDIVDGKPLGGVRISIGYLSSFEDALALLNFAKSTFVNYAVQPRKNT